MQRLAVLTFVPKRSRSRSGMPPPLKHESDNRMTPSLSSEHPYACFIVGRCFMLSTTCVGGRAASSALVESIMLLRVNGCIVHFACWEDFGFAQG